MRYYLDPTTRVACRNLWRELYQKRQASGSDPANRVLNRKLREETGRIRLSYSKIHIPYRKRLDMNTSGSRNRSRNTASMKSREFHGNRQFPAVRLRPGYCLI